MFSALSSLYSIVPLHVYMICLTVWSTRVKKQLWFWGVGLGVHKATTQLTSDNNTLLFTTLSICVVAVF